MSCRGHRDGESGGKRRLLILGCAQKKRPTPGAMPAIDRYDGPRFKVLRKYLRHCLDDKLDVLILSARFGMIRSERMIGNYDQLMTAERARELQPRVAGELGEAFAPTADNWLEPERLLICMGRMYVSALDGVDEPTRSVLRSCVARGSQGQQLARLKSWLYDEGPPPATPPVAEQPAGAARLAGVSLTLSREEAWATIRLVVAREGEIMPQPRVWCVKVDGRAVPVKWLASHLTGVPLQGFTTGQARAALARLGIVSEQC